jgi:hypothetical protein
LLVENPKQMELKSMITKNRNRKINNKKLITNVSKEKYFLKLK